MTVDLNTISKLTNERQETWDRINILTAKRPRFWQMALYIILIFTIPYALYLLHKDNKLNRQITLEYQKLHKINAEIENININNLSDTEPQSNS